MSSSKILVLGGTGAIGVYFVPQLIDLGFDVFVTSRYARVSDNNKLTYIHGNAHDEIFISKTLAYKYDAVVDFMVYSTKEFRQRYELLLNNTKHYIFISSCRVFAESKSSITETTPRLLDVSDDSEYLATDEYALAKARQENMLRESKHNNWTIVRPTITYSKTRFQLGTLESDTIIFRTLNNCPVIFPQEMLCKQTAMTWAGDVAKMVARLTLNQNAFGEDFNVCTNECRTWEEIAGYYQKLIGLKVEEVSLNKYIKAVGGKYQILYSRMFNRVFDNSKILKVTGINEESFTSIYNGLAMELSEYKNVTNQINYILNARMDKITNVKIPLDNTSMKNKILYYSSYTGFIVFLKYVNKFIRHIRSFLCIP